MGLMYGFSIISLLEMFYYGTGKLFTYHGNKWKMKIKTKAVETSAMIRNKTLRKDEPPPEYDLYWQELMPKRRTNIFMGKVFDQ